jgi:EF hand domain-containing protein
METDMKAIKPLLLGASIFALACGGAYAGGDSKNKSASSGASTSASAKYDFNKADKNHDGKVSRAEFDEMMKANASGGGTSSSKTSSGKTSSKPSTSTK